MPRLVLVVDDDPVQRRLAEAALAKAGHRLVCAEDGEAALALMQGPRGDEIAAVVLDLMMPGIDGLDVLARMRRHRLDFPVVVQTARGSIDTAVQAMRAGAFDFVVKPAAPERLQASVANAMKVAEAMKAEEHKSRLQTQTSVKTRNAGAVSAATPASFDDFVSQSPAMARVMQLVRKVATSSIPVLIEGESGVGKEVVARMIQRLGDRRDKPFVTVNCGAIPPNLVESILFGHEKGSFTGASDRHVGKFVEADGGTLFLDEVGDLPLDVQVKLLRAVQEGEVDPVGARSTAKVDIRLISATHRDLIQRVRDGLFREDLYYRLNVFPIHVPALRARREDVELLVHHFIARMASTRDGVTGISPEALALLSAYDWPGNIRQLENAVFRAVVLAETDMLTPAEFPQIRAQLEGFDIEAEPTMQVEMPELDSRGEEGLLHALDAQGEVRALAEMESEMIRLAIQRYNGQMSQVARRLGIGRSTLYRKLKDMGVDPDSLRTESCAS